MIDRFLWFKGIYIFSFLLLTIRYIVEVVKMYKSNQKYEWYVYILAMLLAVLPINFGVVIWMFICYDDLSYEEFNEKLTESKFKEKEDT